MPEFSKEINAALDFKNKLIELKKKLVVEKKMYEAAKMIKTRMDKQSSVQQVENSLTESLVRISFLEREVNSMEKEISDASSTKISRSNVTEYFDALEITELSPSTSQKSSQENNRINLNWFLAGQQLTWSKIDHKIDELSCRLKFNESILEAEEKIIEAFKGQSVRTDLLESKEVTKRRVQILGQALKKYTTLIIGSGASPATSEISTDLLHGEETLFTGKLMIKVTKISGLTGSNTAPPFTFNFHLDQLANYRSGNSNSKKSVESAVLAGYQDKTDPSAYNCYQEIVINLVRSSELELTISSGSSQSIKGIFFIKLATLFGIKSDEECAVSNVFEIEPSGSVNLQFYFVPNKSKILQINKERAARLERRPAIKHTKHSIQGHELISANFFQLLKCSFCQDMIFNTGGYQCKLCKLICHKKCYNKLFEKCLYSEDKLKNSQKQKGQHEQQQEQQDPLIEQFASKYNIPHRQKLVSVAIPSWCAHCGHILPLGRKINYKCEECFIVWHDRCDPHICKNHCGLTGSLIETYLSTMKSVKRDQIVKSNSSIKSSIPQLKIECQQQSPVSKMKNLKIEDFELITCLGKGNFGKVMLARYKLDLADSRCYAIKILKKHSIVENEEFENVKTEKRIFRLATSEGNPFLVHLEATFHDEFRVYFVMEYVNGGDLMYHIQNGFISSDGCKFYAAQVLVALEFLHSKGILYRDLKLDNILMTKEGNLKLADYGLCKCDMTSESKTKTFCGTPEFMAPELVAANGEYGFAVDYWAFGVLLYQMLECKSPFYGNNDRDTYNSILMKKVEFSAKLDKNGRSLISKLLMKNPSERLGIKNGDGWGAVKNHPFFNGIDWVALKALKLSAPFVPKIKNEEDFSNFDEIFTTQDITLTPYPSFVYAKGGEKVSQSIEAFSEF